MITFNHEKYIAEAIEGVLGQKVTFKIELVIGEDCSSDLTRNICQNYADKYPDLIRLLPSEKNLGMTENGLRTLNECYGKYIAFCEGDDYWSNSFKLQKQVDFLEKNIEYGLVHSDCDFLFQNDKKLIKNNDQKTKLIIPNGNVFERLIVYNFVKTLTVCFRRDLLNNKEFWELFGNEKWPMGDYPMWIEFSRHTKFYYISESLATRRVLSESASNHRRRSDNLSFLLSACEISLFFCDKYGCKDEIKIEIRFKQNKLRLQKAFFLNDKKTFDIIFQELKGVYGFLRIGFKYLMLYYIMRSKVLSSILRVCFK
jgi:glycosyltransferase involved in cell wall biosynthesis